MGIFEKNGLGPLGIKVDRKVFFPCAKGGRQSFEG
jgi:hypothetical protein